MTVVVLGSVNADLVLSAPHLPEPGETIRATNVATYLGGKGANQAIAAARMGAEVILVGRVGADDAGRRSRDELEAEGIDVSALHIDPDAPTGTALITVSDGGENTIVTAGGANHLAGRHELDAVRAALAGASVLLVQLEIPMDVVAQAVAFASAADVAVVCDPAPVAELPSELWPRITWITPNEREAVALTGESAPNVAARTLHERGVAHAVVTIGADGCVCAGDGGELWVPAPPVHAVDTVAAGDAFAGALAAGIAAGDGDLEHVLRVACAAGALAATKPGAAASLPGADDVRRLLASDPG